ncbi:MAG TPA: hypothetical protein VFO66_01740 [Gemmatimonadaceae bacterium]|nr:hypothetical protein [Gemmatimonadaceae bacterium]
MIPFTFRRVSSLVVTAALSATLAGCLDTVSPEEEEPDIHGVVVAAATGSAASGSATLTLGTPQSGSLTLQGGTSNALTVRVLGVNMLDEPIVAEHHADFEIRFVAANGVPLTSTMGSGYPLAFSVRPEGTGSQGYRLQVISTDHGHVEREFPITVTVQ